MANDVWEYQVVEKGTLAFRTCKDEQIFLSKMGEEGWEHYNTAINNVVRTYYFKRMVKAKRTSTKPKT